MNIEHVSVILLNQTNFLGMLLLTADMRNNVAVSFVGSNPV